MLKYFRPGKTVIEALASTSARVQKPPQIEAPGGLFPIRLAAWQMDEYRLGNGWPRPVPDFDIRARSLTSAEGEVLADRESPRSIETKADGRWIADTDYYDSVTWQPHASTTELNFDALAGHEPTVGLEYDYKFGSAVFSATVLNFDADSAQYLSVDTSALLHGAGAYTVLMVVSLSSVYGNSLRLPYSGIWCPADVSGGWLSLTLQGTALYLETEQTARTKVLSVANLLGTSAPIKLALVVDQPRTRVYAGFGPAAIRSDAVYVGSEVRSLTSLNYLGRTGDDLLHTADMTLLDLGLYGTALSGKEIRDEFATLSSVYGGEG